MKKLFSIFLVLTLAFFTLPFSGNTVLADGVDSSVNPDKTFTINYNIMHENGNKPSISNDFFEKPANLFEKDDKTYLQMKINNGDMVKELSNKYGDAVQIKKENNSIVLQLRVNDDLSDMKLDMHVTVPSGAIENFPGYDEDHEAILVFDQDSKQLEQDNTDSKENDGESPEDAEDQDQTDNPDGSDENSDKDSGDGDATESDSEDTTKPENESGPKDDVTKPDQKADTTPINVSYIKEDSEEKSAMASYLESPVFLEAKDGNVLVTITINDNETVTKLQIEGKNAVDKVVEGDERHETFELDQLDSVLNGYVEYQAPFQGGIFESDADFRITLDEDALSDFKAANNLDNDDKDKDESKSDKDDKKDKDKKDKKGKKGTKEEKKSKQLVPDKAYTINYTIMHEDGKKPSVSNDFFVKPAKLFEKDGKTYMQMTINNGDMITELSNKYGDIVLVEENKDGSIIVQLRVNNDLSDMKLNMHVTVPAGAIPGFPGYDEDHEAILVFDKDSKEEVKVGNSLLVASNNDNGPTVEGVETGGVGSKGDDKDQTPKKPEFESNGDNNGTSGSNGDKTDNPQTGDTSQVLLLSLLLIGSLTPLAIKARRRFI